MELKSHFICAALLLATFIARGQGFIFDQQSAISPASVAGAVGLQAGSPTGQSFTPALAEIGFVQFVLFDVNNGNGLGATVFVNVRSGGITGPILGTSESVTMPDSFGQTSTGNGPPVSVFLFAATINLQPGTIYYLEPVVQSGDQWAIRGSEFGYAGGAGIINGLPTANGVDTWFREGVYIVPEPSAFAVVLLGAGVFAWRRRQKIGR